MTRLMLILLLLTFAAPLSGCGIKGGLDTPPPLWGDSARVDATADTQSAPDPLANPLDENEDEDVGYGVDVADQP